MISRDGEYRRSLLGDLQYRFESPSDVDCRDSTAIEDIPPMHNEINFTAESRLQGPVEVLEKIRSPPSPVDSRMDRQIKTKVRVCEEENSRRGICHLSRKQ